MKKLFVLLIALIALGTISYRALAQNECPTEGNWMVINFGEPRVHIPGVEINAGQEVSIVCVNGIMYTQEKSSDQCLNIEGMKQGYIFIKNVGECVFSEAHLFLGTIPEATALSFTKTPTATNTPSPTPKPTITETPRPTATEQSIVATENKISVQKTETTSTEQLPAKANIVIIALALVLIAGILALIFKKKKNH